MVSMARDLAHVVVLTVLLLLASYTKSQGPAPSPFAPTPFAPTPTPHRPSTPTPFAPAPTPHRPSTPTPSPILPPTPDASSPPPVLSSPPSIAAPSPSGKDGENDSRQYNSSSSKRRMSGGKKAGIVIGVLLAVALGGFVFVTYMKRKKNMRRAHYSYGARRMEL